ncbi:hypothetical protein [Facklamia miroungae]|uniref:Uncharacterized protein n=1 Tax=Facklamia miroungae TaxID=120956 RepID=A0A1G7RWZ1_9LACT|nr:hypothetical protein [Facklamia miroungae]NKZ29245.1 hypothetical protein [Facklamia miroungae]SDG15276.1 hypothetical protein SAMN05421791_103210 [Facklamia miroungae]
MNKGDYKEFLPRLGYKDAIILVTVMMVATIFLPYLLVKIGVQSPFLFSLSGAILVGMTPLSIYSNLKKHSHIQAKIIRLTLALIYFLFTYFAARYNIIF